jgi:hypothetical protein
MVRKWYESDTNGTKAKERLMNYCNPARDVCKQRATSVQFLHARKSSIIRRKLSSFILEVNKNRQFSDIYQRFSFSLKECGLIDKKEMKYILVFGTFGVKKVPRKVPNKKLVLAKNRRELRLNYISCYYGAKMTQKLAQKIEINSFDSSNNPKLQISAHNESIMSQNMSHKGDGSL